MQDLSSLNRLADSLSANSFSSKKEEQQFDEQFLKPDFDVLIIIVNKLSQIREDCYKRHKLLSILTNFIYCDNTLKLLLSKTCQMSSTELQLIGSKISTTLVSIPDIVSNTMKTNISHKFDENVYYNRLVESIYICVEEVCLSIKQGIDSSLELLSSLLGRIAFIGFSDIVFKQFISKVLNDCKNDFIWRRIAYRVIVSQQKQEYIEALVKCIFGLVSNYETIVWLIGQSVDNLDIKSNSKIKFLLTNKFLLINEFKSDIILINIFGYLSKTSSKLFFEAFDNVLNAWSNSSAIKYRSYSQHLYLSKSLMIGSRFLKDIDFTTVEDRFRRLTMSGIELHLKNSQTDFRNIGLTVGQHLMSLFYRESNKIDFEIEETEEIKHLKDLFINNCNDNHILECTEQKTSDENNCDTKIDKNDNSVRINDLDSDDDEDADLIPFDMSNDKPVKQTKRPIYLRDCMEGLLDHEKTEWFSLCLKNAEQVIRKNSDTVSEVSVEFAQILLRLDDNSAIEDFVGLRMRSLIALCVCSPKLVASYLGSQFYASNHTIRQRLDILEVLLSASSELSANVPDFERHTAKSSAREILNVTSAQEKNAEIHWTQVIDSRVKEKTRILSHKTKELPVKTSVNRLSPYAPDFFFPLLKSIDRCDIRFDLMEEDHYVFGRLLYTLAIIIKNVSFHPITRQMGKELLELILAFRYHSEV